MAMNTGFVTYIPLHLTLRYVASTNKYRVLPNGLARNCFTPSSSSEDILLTLLLLTSTPSVASTFFIFRVLTPSRYNSE